MNPVLTLKKNTRGRDLICGDIHLNLREKPRTSNVGEDVKVCMHYFGGH